MKECFICKGELIKSVDENQISAETIYKANFYHATKIDKYICLKCGYIHSYARNPKVFTDVKYISMSVNEASEDSASKS